MNRLLTAVFLVLAVSCAKHVVYKTSWQEDTIVMDGIDDDWKGKMYYDSKSKMMYGINNDNTNLYVKIKATDPTSLRKIMMGGFTFWMDTVGKNKKMIEIRYPLEGSMAGMMDKKGNRQGQKSGKKDEGEYQKNIQKKLQAPLEMEVKGLKGYEMPTVLLRNNNEGIKHQ